MSLIEHGFCSYELVDEVLIFDNLIMLGGWLLFNILGGNLVECYMYGFGLVVEVVC